jgi:hypothetical protein
MMTFSSFATIVSLSLISSIAFGQDGGGYVVTPPAMGFTVPSSPPQPPASVMVSPSSDSSLRIEWSAPLDDGGADLLAYKVLKYLHELSLCSTMFYYHYYYYYSLHVILMSPSLSLSLL